MNDLKHDTKVALVTGSARRIGASIAEALHRQGYNIVVHYNKSKADADNIVRKLLNSRDNSAVALQGNLQDIDDLSTLAESAVTKWGQLDLLVNNASCFYPTPIPAAQDTQTPTFKIIDWNEILDTNLRAPYVLSLLLADELRKTGGSIINLVDIYSERPLKNHSIYNMSKAGIAMMTQTLARELAPEIRVNGVSPGAILWPENDTETAELGAVQERIISQTPLARCGSPTDICEAVSYLASSQFVTGQIIKVDGGRSLHL
ncbi:pteridine reductase [Alkalimarinus sediminis]|uniref:Pteridine reductase n=1 Tax=Alkalimarinus sediminis TaxID=1632866 RepID=A0A9E8HTJ0_9ALTE|nr:pteridine reductase [Alkalimarinus sediminis]UZW75479.1 pteridine reductase [Alkalimarinus sediminis]